MEPPSKQRIDYDHNLLQSRPNFAKALKDFETFLIATQEDLQRKFRVLNEQRNNRKTSRNVRTYLSLQNYLLQKHLRRLAEFEIEILSRVSAILNNSNITIKDADGAFLQLLADMSKMKTRCKHILDVTDRYCVLSEDAGANFEAKLENEAENFKANMSEDSLDSNDSNSSSGSSANSNSAPKLNGNVIKTTVSSVSSHLAVIAKTYTKRHSSSHLNTSV